MSFGKFRGLPTVVAFPENKLARQEQINCFKYECQRDHRSATHHWMHNSTGHSTSVFKVITIGWSHFRSASNKPLKLFLICLCVLLFSCDQAALQMVFSVRLSVCCHIQYIGETSQPLSGRFSDHKSRIRNHNATKKDTLLIDHFNNGTCKGMDYSVNIMETIQQPAKIGQMLDQATTTLRRKREDFWMEELHTIYPYGLNNRHGNNQDQRNEEMSVRTMFHRKAKKRKKRSRRSPHIPTKTAEHIYDLITGTFQKKNTPDHYPEQLNSAIITAQKIIPQMNKVELKKIGGMAHEDTIKECNIPLRLLHIIIDLTAAKLQVKTDEKPQASKKKIEHAFTIKYVNHWIDKLRLGNILHDHALVETTYLC